MCLVLIAVGAHPKWPLVVLSNRDEFHARKTAFAAAWEDAPGVFAGRDLEKGGTWTGIRGRRFAAVTNVRSPLARREGRSRGELVAAFLRGDAPARDYATALEIPAYPSFNLLATDDGKNLYSASDDGVVEPVPPGVHGLSNARLDDPWPKVERGRERLAALLEEPGGVEGDGAWAILGDREPAPDERLPRTGVPLELERALSPAFVVLPEYGTRAMTRVLFGADGSVRFAERAFGPGGAPLAAVDFVA